MPLSAFLFTCLLAANLVDAYSFYFSSQPTQCQPLTVHIEGEGKPPYRLLLADGNPAYESGRWTDVRFSGSSHTIQALQWSGGSQIVAMVSDLNGIGTGGTSGIIPVSNSTDARCDPQFKYDDAFFHWEFRNSISSCKLANLSIWTNLSAITPPLSGFVMLLSGQSFALDLSAQFKNLERAWFQWLVNVPPESYFIMGLGDATSDLKGTMHYPHFVGDSGDTSCYNASSPRVTSSPAESAASISKPASSPYSAPAQEPTHLPDHSINHSPDSFRPTPATATPGPSTQVAGISQQRTPPPVSTSKSIENLDTIAIVAEALGAIIGLLFLACGAFAFWWRTSYTKRVRAAQMPRSYSMHTSSTTLSSARATAPAGTPISQKVARLLDGRIDTELRRENAQTNAPIAAPPPDVREDTVPPPYAGL
ncbi:hypothetical protein AURDEDRAFT_164034 [Auricularia subglabra TFB-10046 SS5]|nr:hypothetical protein AURDEDRAFT_164034 [Auricularia subglabra TFB-10046 SS5]